MKRHTKHLIIWTCCQIFLFHFLKAQTNSVNFPQNKDQKLNELYLYVEKHATEGVKTISSKIIEYKNDLLKKYHIELDTLFNQLNRLRHPYYQYRVYVVAQGFLGKNFYHDYYIKDRNQNDETNTCVNGWCQVMAGTGLYPLTTLTDGQITFLKNTIEAEKKKKKPNLWQKKPKYVNVSKLLAEIETWGFLPIDLDWAQRGDICVQYYRKTRIKNEFTAQHISIVDMVVPWGNGWFELRDWHEGIENEPFTYRTGTNMTSSNNNIFTPENVYFGFQNDLGTERPLYGSNPNICQAYGYFGENIEKARPIIKEMNNIRGKIFFWRKIDPEILTAWIKKG